MKYAMLFLFAISASAQILPVDTAVVVTVGPLIDDGDFKTLETSIAYNAAGMSVDLIESSGAASTKTDLTLTTGGTSDWTHLGNGIYEIEITAAQNDTEGNLQVVGVADGVLPFFSPVYTVVPVSVFNSLVAGSDNLQVDTIQVEGSDATDQINAAADTALADYDGPTNAEMVARTLAAADYFDPAADTVANVTTVGTLTGHTPQTADHTANIAAILADTSAMDTASELRTLLTGSDTPVATQTAQSTAQSDLDTLTGADGATLATVQPNYAPYTGTPPTVGAIRTEMETAGGHLALILEDTGTTLPSTLSGLATASALSTHDAKLDTVDDYLDTEIAAILADTNELQTRFGNMIEADGGDWRFTTNALEQAPGGGSGGDASEANQLTILDRLAGIMDKDHSLSVAVGDFDPATDSLEAVRDAISAIDVGGGSGDTLINHDSGGADTLRVVDGNGNGIVDATIQAYVASAFSSNPLTATVQATATTAADGRWKTPMLLDSGTEYTLYIYKQAAFGPATVDITP